MFTCIHCGSPKVKKNGIRNDIQRYLCRSCGKQFEFNVKAAIEKMDMKKTAYALFSAGASLRVVGELLSVSASTVSRWIATTTKPTETEITKQREFLLKTAADPITPKWIQKSLINALY
jgi:transposase-like protein